MLQLWIAAQEIHGERSVYALDSRFRGNDDNMTTPVIPASAGIQVGQSCKAFQD